MPESTVNESNPIVKRITTALRLAELVNTAAAKHYLLESGKWLTRVGHTHTMKQVKNRKQSLLKVAAAAPAIAVNG